MSFGFLSFALMAVLARPLASAPMADSQGAFQGESRGPRFLLASADAGSPRTLPIDVARTPVLQQRIALSLDGVSLKRALTTIEEKSGIDLAFSSDVVSLDRTVRLRADDITVAAALTAILVDADVDVVFTREGRAILKKRLPEPLPPPPPPVGSVSGKVTAARTADRAVSQARVSVEGTSIATTTGADGAFRLDSVPVGTQTIRFAAIGYEPARVRVVVSANGTVTANVVLEPKGVTLDELVVSGTAFATQRKTVSSPINVITARDIEIKQVNNITDLMRGEIPGVISFANGSNDYESRLYARGNSGALTYDAMKIYIDGIEVASTDYISTIDPNSIERIEVLRGPQASTIYGSGAGSGVLQIFTKKGTESKRPIFRLRSSFGVIESDYKPTDIGTAMLNEEVLGVTGGSKEFSYNVNASYVNSGEWLTSIDSRTLSFSGGLRTVQGPVTVELHAQGSDRRFRLPGVPIFWDFPTTPFCQYCGKRDFRFPDRLSLGQNTIGLNVNYRATPRWQHTLIVGTDINRFGQGHDTPRNQFVGDSLFFLANEERQSRSIRYNTAYDAALGKRVTGRFTAGADYRKYDVAGSTFYNLAQAEGSVETSPSTLILDILNDHWWTAGYFGMGELGIADQLFLTLAARVETGKSFGKDYGQAVSPRVGIAYSRNLGQVEVKVRGGWGKTIRPPQSYARNGSNDGRTRVLPNPNLGPEEKKGWDAGVELYWGQRASLVLTTFNEEGTNLVLPIDIDLTSIPRTRQYRNIGRVTNKGWEIEGTVNAGPVSLSANYGSNDNVIRELGNVYGNAGPNAVPLPGDRPLNVPKYTAGATLISRLWRGTASLNMNRKGEYWQFNFVSIFRQLDQGLDPIQPGIPRSYLMLFKPWTSWNFRTEQALSNRLTVFFRVDNIGNNQRSDWGNATVARGRTTVGGMSVTF